MSNTYNLIEGKLIILKDGRIFIDDKELHGGDIVHLEVDTLKDIITDAKVGLL